MSTERLKKIQDGLSTSQLDEYIQMIPGYDPTVNADGYWFDYDAANRALQFFADCITHVKGSLAGQPYILEDHEIAITANIFGWKDSNGYRRYKEVFYFVPRKNSKTTWAAGLALKCFFDDGEFGAECYCAAADKEQATLLFGQAASMVRHYEELDNSVKIYQATKSIYNESTNSAFKSISADAATKHGYNSHLVIIDELHAQPNRDLVDVLCTSTGSRKQPLIVYITTSDFERPSICNEKHDYATKVRDGVFIDPKLLPAIYEASITDDWTSPEVWAKANPNLGKSVSYEYIEHECKRAQEVPAYENTFKRLHLNIRTEQDVRWMQMDKWNICDKQTDPEELVGRECYLGVDLSATKDLTSICLVFPDEDDKYDIISHSWIPAENATKKERSDKVPYRAWEKSGFVTITSGNAIDQNAVKEKVMEWSEKYDIQLIGIDPWNATQFAIQLQDEGMDVVHFRQGYASMSAPTKELEMAVLDGRIRHGGNPVLRWAASNMTVTMDSAGNVKPDKDKSYQKIDPIVAMIIAIGCAMSRRESADCEVILL